MSGSDPLAASLADRVAARALATGRPAPVYLLTGVAPVAGMAWARRLAAALLCRGPEPRPCGHCQACRWSGAGTHPDLVVADTTAWERPTEELRRLVAALAVPPVWGPWRVVVMSGGERWLQQAYSVLLKPLEDPQPHTVFLLVLDSPDAVPAPLRSRCQVLRLAGGRVDATAAALVSQGLDEDSAWFWSRACAADLPAAQERLGDQRWTEAASRAAAFWAAADRWLGDRQELGRWALELAVGDREDVCRRLECVVEVGRELWRASLGGREAQLPTAVTGPAGGPDHEQLALLMETRHRVARGANSLVTVLACLVALTAAAA